VRAPNLSAPARRVARNPGRTVSIAFAAAILIGTVLLSIPVARVGPGGAPVLTALFTSTSAVCVTGLTVVDTATYWTPFGQVVIMGLVQIGGFGIMAGATLLGFLVSRRLRLRNQLVAQAEIRAPALGDVRSVLRRVAVTILICEAGVTLILAARFFFGYDYHIGKALWHGLFHAVSAFNDAGFALYSDSLIRFISDWWICLPVIVAVTLGGIGYPVLLELRRQWRRPANWSTHTRITVWGTLVLLGVGFFSMLLFEWANPRTYGSLGVGEKLLAAFFQGTMPRTAGFQNLDLAALNLESLAVLDMLMFIGGGSGGTAGGIKVTTFFLLAFVIWAEVNGEKDVTVGRRRIAESVQRQALTIALLSVAVVAVGTMALIATTTGVRFEAALTESIAAFTTGGLSMNLTPTLPGAAQVVLIVLMYIGRVGTVTVATAVALNTKPRLYRYPEERPIVG
jgi:potassium uptake TrkH family protein